MAKRFTRFAQRHADDGGSGAIVWAVLQKVVPLAYPESQDESQPWFREDNKCGAKKVAQGLAEHG